MTGEWRHLVVSNSVGLSPLGAPGPIDSRPGQKTVLRPLLPTFVAVKATDLPLTGLLSEWGLGLQPLEISLNPALVSKRE